MVKSQNQGTNTKTVKHWEELKLIKSIRKHKTKHDKNVIVGIGDDTAVVTVSKGTKFLYTVDSVVDGIHFLGDSHWQSAGKRAIGAATSDIAAMGGIPLYAMLSLFLPKGFPLKHINAFIKGFLQGVEEFNMSLIGGNITTMNGRFAADTVVIGKAYKNRFLTRNGAKIGDIVCMAGVTGEAIAGLDLLLSGHTKQYPELIKKYLEPAPMLKEALAIVDNLHPHSMIDVSDGLLQDIMHIVEESKVGVILDLDSIPVSEGVSYTARLMKKSPYDYILRGGDDYVLVFTMPEARYRSRINGLPIYKIGKIIKGSGIQFYKGYKRVYMKSEKAGYVHKG